MSRPTISSTPSHAEVLAVFNYYAGAYELMEEIQEPDPRPDAHKRLLPTGDQKTGCIGEYWAMRYARRQFRTHRCRFGHHSQQGWDIAVEGTSTRIQVKTVSAWSKTRGMSPIHRPDHKPATAPDDWAPWTDLWLVYLNAKLFPTGFWKFGAQNRDFGDQEKRASLKIRVPGNKLTGSQFFQPWPDNAIGKLTA